MIYQSSFYIINLINIYFTEELQYIKFDLTPRIYMLSVKYNYYKIYYYNLIICHINVLFCFKSFNLIFIC